MASEPDVTHLHQEIDQTRSDLTDKLQTLEEQVRGTVLGATEKVEQTIEQVTSTVQETVEQVKSTVGDTVETAKSAVSETVENVRQTFDLKYQVETRPWTMVVGSACVGLLAGALVGRQTRPRRFHRSFAPSAFRAPAEAPTAAAEQYVSGVRPVGEPPAAAREEGPSWLGQLYRQFEPEINSVKEMAIGYAAGMLRDLIKESVPVLRDRIEDVMNRATTKFGGEPVHGPVLRPAGEERPTERGSFGGPVH
jgi:ElaB/YqjD/DUF883 family membrane-anchored ribosome-binding protein